MFLADSLPVDELFVSSTILHMEYLQVTIHYDYFHLDII